MSTSTPTGNVRRRLGLRRPEAPAGTSGERTAVATAAFDVTIVVPTRNEAGNVAELIRRLNAALRATRAEVVFVDDSDDDTPAVILAEAEHSPLPVRLLHRPAGDREGRLGGAVVLGFQHANAPWALVIDGDLQHPPEAVPNLVAATRTPGVDLVYGTRYADAGDASGLGGRTRAMVSAWSTKLAKAFFPSRLTGITDPMSGFFAVRLGALDLTTLRPPGYKVLLEVLAVSRLRGTVGVPFAFQPRFSGDSKASFAEGLRYLQQLVALRLGTSVAALTRLVAFLAVGLSGVGINTAVLWGLSAGAWHQPYLLASLVATNVAVIWNFVLLESFVLKKSRKHSPWQGFLRFWWLNMMLLPVQLGLLALFVEVLSFNPVVANVVVLTIVFVIRYLATTMWVYERAGSTVAAGRTGDDDELEIFAPTVGGPLVLLAAPAVRVALRLAAAIAAAMVAFPAVARHIWHLLGDRPLTAVAVAVVVIAAGALVAARAIPPAGDPDVHDRQLDFILALPALAAAIFLSLAWPGRFTAAGPASSRQLLAFTVFLTGAALLLLGTRCTARLRVLLLAPLLMLPVVERAPVVELVLVVLFGVLVANAAWRALSHRYRASVGRLLPAAIGRRLPPALPGSAFGTSARVPTKLPNWQPTVLLVLALAAVLGVLAIAAPAPAVAAPIPSLGTR